MIKCELLLTYVEDREDKQSAFRRFEKIQESDVFQHWLLELIQVGVIKNLPTTIYTEQYKIAIQNTKYKIAIQNTKYKIAIQNTKYKIQNTK